PGTATPPAPPPPPPRRERPTIWGPELPPVVTGPPPPGVGGPGGHVPPRSTWRMLLPGAILCSVTVAAAVGVVVYAGNQDDHPDEWDPRVVELVEFVEDERGLAFEHPVAVDFLTPQEYSDAVRIDAGELSDDDAEALERNVALLRALGLADGDVDPVESMNDLADAGTLAYYDLVTRHVVVRGTELTPDVEATLVHELTHALQDQHFDLHETQNDIDPDAEGSDDAFVGYQALVEGDAMRIEGAYVQSLSEAERQAYVDAYGEALAESEEELSDVPSAMHAFGIVPYALGSPLVDLIAAEGGNDAVDEAFEELPSTAEHMLDPRSYLDGDGPAEPVELDEPPLPEGVDGTTDEGITNAVDLYVILAERIDPVVALDAADGWGNGRWVTYEQDDRTCVRMRVATDTDEDAEELTAALEEWVAVTPPAADTRLLEGDDVPLIESCDPGDDAAVANDRALDVLQLPALRSQFMVEAVRYGGLDLDEAWDYGHCIVSEIDFEQLLALSSVTDPSEVPQEVTDAVRGCFEG
ncbi:MAG TPA: hypothetical protein VIL36_02920, partial [Acidimicrobiales bacterium]